MKDSTFSQNERSRFIEILSNENSSPVFDLCIVGGGITGAAIARDAALRGLHTLLIEKDDFAQGTSSRSSKLVHGGIRYLENFEFGLVAESTRERALLWKHAPELVKPLGFVFPTYKNSRLPLWKLDIGVWLYDILSFFRSPSLHKLFFRDRTLKKEPALRNDQLVGSVFYWDAATDDGLLTLANIIDAHNNGAFCLSQAKLKSVDWNPKNSLGPDFAHKIHIEAKDFKQDSTKQILFTAKARSVVSATGPWTDEFLGHAVGRPSTAPKKMAPTRGSHIVVSAKKIPINSAIVLTHPTDGRVLFGIPWEGFTVVGTTDVFDNQNPDTVRISADEINYLVQACAFFFPNHPIEAHDILSAWSGLRPLLAPPDSASASEISREHVIEWKDPGFLMIAGGKLTTHREMAEQAVDRILAETQSWEIPLKHGKVFDCLTHARKLPLVLGGRKIPSSISDLTFEVLDDMCKTQMILHLEDLLVRRTEIFYKDTQNGLEKINQIREPLCSILGWTENRWQIELNNYKTYVDFNFLEPKRNYTSLLGVSKIKG